MMMMMMMMKTALEEYTKILGKLSHVLSKIREIFIGTLNKKNSLNFSACINFVKFYITPYLSEF